MEANKKFDLVLRLRVRTQEGKQEWRTTGDREIFQTVVGPNTVELDNGHAAVKLIVRNGTGFPVFSVDPTDVPEGELAGLLEAAQGSAASPEKTMESLLKHLE
jgi:hypothetical protein